MCPRLSSSSGKTYRARKVPTLGLLDDLYGYTVLILDFFVGGGFRGSGPYSSRFLERCQTVESQSTNITVQRGVILSRVKVLQSLVCLVSRPSVKGKLGRSSSMV